MCRSDCGRLDEPPGLDVSQGHRHRRSSRCQQASFEVVIVMVVAGRHAGRAAPPTDTSSLERYPLTRGGTHSYCRRIIAAILAPPLSDHHRASASSSW
jgi:hypothetical protein